MSQIEWAMWANEQAVASSAVLFVGGVLAVSGKFSNWQFGIYAVLAGLLIFLIEWPRGKRTKGTTIERQFQRPLTDLVNKFGIAGRNYFIRFVAYLLLCVPCCFILATLLGGACLLITSIIYFVAAVKGEEWKPTGLEDKTATKRTPSLHPPNRPPPRAGDQAAEPGEVSHEAVAMEIIMEDSSDGRTQMPRRPPPNPAEMKPSRPPPRPLASGAKGTR